MERERVEHVKSREGSAELVERARAGDRDAFGELVRIHQHEVYTLAVRLVHDRDLASDVTQDAFVRAWRAMSGFRGEAKFSTWLHRITVNTAWTHRTRRDRVRLDPLDSLRADPESESLEPERAGESVLVAPSIENALSSLSTPVRSVVVLKDIYDWTHAEIADHLDISVTAAKVRLHRGRKELRRLLRSWSEVSP